MSEALHIERVSRREELKGQLEQLIKERDEKFPDAVRKLQEFVDAQNLYETAVRQRLNLPEYIEEKQRSAKEHAYDVVTNVLPGAESVKKIGMLVMRFAFGDRIPLYTPSTLQDVKDAMTQVRSLKELLGKMPDKEVEMQADAVQAEYDFRKMLAGMNVDDQVAFAEMQTQIAQVEVEMRELK